MFQIIVVPHSSKANAALFFKTKETADIAHKNLHDAQKGVLPVQVLVVKDDFGCTMTMDKENICYVMLMESDRQQELARMMGMNGTNPNRMVPEA